MFAHIYVYDTYVSHARIIHYSLSLSRSLSQPFFSLSSHTLHTCTYVRTLLHTHAGDMLSLFEGGSTVTGFSPGDRVWLDTAKLVAVRSCWLDCIRLHPRNQTDTGCRVRPGQGISAIGQLDPGTVCVCVCVCVLCFVLLLFLSFLMCLFVCCFCCVYICVCVHVSPYAVSFKLSQASADIVSYLCNVESS
jgi:Lecithin:cholesterol acyltransferase